MLENSLKERRLKRRLFRRIIQQFKSALHLVLCTSFLIHCKSLAKGINEGHRQRLVPEGILQTNENSYIEQKNEKWVVKKVKCRKVTKQTSENGQRGFLISISLRNGRVRWKAYWHQTLSSRMLWFPCYIWTEKERWGLVNKLLVVIKTRKIQTSWRNLQVSLWVIQFLK